MAKKVLKYSENEFVTLLENIVKRVKREERLEKTKKKRFQLKESPIRRDIGSHRDMMKYGKNTKWVASSKNHEHHYDMYTEKYGPFTVYINDDDSIKIACLENGDCYDQTDRMVSREKAAQMLGVESLDMIE